MYKRRQTRVLIKQGSFSKKRKKVNLYSNQGLMDFYDFLKAHNPGSKILEHVVAQMNTRGITV